MNKKYLRHPSVIDIRLVTQYCVANISFMTNGLSRVKATSPEQFPAFYITEATFQVLAHAFHITEATFKVLYCGLSWDRGDLNFMTLRSWIMGHGFMNHETNGTSGILGSNSIIVDRHPY